VATREKGSVSLSTGEKRGPKELGGTKKAGVPGKRDTLPLQGSRRWTKVDARMTKRIVSGEEKKKRKGCGGEGDCLEKKHDDGKG